MWFPAPAQALVLSQPVVFGGAAKATILGGGLTLRRVADRARWLPFGPSSRFFLMPRQLESEWVERLSQQGFCCLLGPTFTF